MSLKIPIYLCGAALGVMFVVHVSVNSQTQSKTAAQKKAKAAIQKARQDSIAQFRADSIHWAQVASTIADSLRRHADSLGRVEDSLKAFQFRKLENKAFDVGERLVFDVNFGPINAGQAVMAVAKTDTIAGRKCYRVDFTVNSHPSFNWIYKVEDWYYTFIDVETLAPWRFEQHIREGSYKRDFIADFDQVNGIARTSEGEYKIPPYVHDIMSAFYYARTIDYSGYAKGQGPTLFNFYKDKSNELFVRLLGRQELEVQAGTFRTIVVEPIVKEGGLFRSEGRIVIWLSDDELKIPVRVNTKVIVGSIDSELVQYSGLKGNLTSRIK